MTEVAVDYAGLVGDLSRPLTAVAVGQVLLDAAGDRYQGVCTRCSLVQFPQSGATYLFDFASAVNAEQEDRTVAAWAVTPAAVARSLNRGWSDEGKRFRGLEREAAATPGTFYFGHLLYQDDTAYPMAIEIGILRDGTLHVDRFQNRFPRG